MRVLLIAKDPSPSQALTKITDSLLKRGLETKSLFRESVNKESLAGVLNSYKPNIILSGFSSSPELAAGELLACEWAIKNNAHIALFSDTYRAWGRKWFEHLRQHTDLLYVVNEVDAKEARALFTKTKIVATGNPAWEEKFKPKYNREDVRKKIGVLENEIMLLCPGGKDLLVNLLHWTAVLAAANTLLIPIKVVLSMHPNDKNFRGYYAALASASKIIAEILENDVISGDDLVVAADIVISSASSVGDVTATCQRKPVINFFTTPALERLEKNTGSRTWPPCDEYHVTEKVVDDFRSLALCIKELLDGTRNLKPQQEKIYPRPTEGAAELIAYSLAKYTKSQN